MSDLETERGETADQRRDRQPGAALGDRGEVLKAEEDGQGRHEGEPGGGEHQKQIHRHRQAPGNPAAGVERAVPAKREERERDAEREREPDRRKTQDAVDGRLCGARREDGLNDVLHGVLLLYIYALAFFFEARLPGTATDSPAR